MERDLTIETLVAGGEGLARSEGRVVLVPLVVPGDRVRVGPGTVRGGVERAELRQVLEPGADRVVPSCALAGTCGGCDWQQVGLGAQQRAKEAIVREALGRIGGLDVGALRPLVPSPLPRRYRRRLRAHLTPTGWGFTRRGSHELVPVPACELVEAGVERLAHAVSDALHEGLGLGALRTFAIDADEAGARGAVHLELVKAPEPKARGRVERLLARVPALQGAVVTGGEAPGRRPASLVVGQPVMVDEGHRRLRVRPDLFAQANRMGARKLADAVGEGIEPGERVLELFAGAGTLSLAIAERAGEFLATEGDGPALELLRASLRERGLQARLVSGPAARVTDGLAREGERFDHVVLDPPRTGARDVIGAIGKLAPRRITYVSCDPATFARDAGQLVRLGWRLEEVVPYDLFPHTHHVELVARLGR